MGIEKNKISIRQLFIMFIVASFSPATQLLPTIGAKYAHQAGWVSTVVGVTAFLLLTVLLSALFRRGDSGPSGLGDLYELVFGKFAGKVIMSVYLIWAAFLYLTYIRYYAERMLSTIFTTTDIRFFIFVMMVMVFFTLRGRVRVLARFSEVSVLIFTVVLIVITLGVLPLFQPRYVWPVTHLDAVPVLRASLPISGSLGAVTMFMFLGEFVSDKHEIGKKGRGTALYLGIFLTMISIVCIGTLSAQVVNRSPMPFFSTTKLITVIEPLERIEALLFSIWVISDFVIITALALIIMSILKRLFGVAHTHYFAAPLAFFGFVGGVYIATSTFELELLSDSALRTAVNLASGYGIPLLALLVGRIRKKI